MHFIFAAVVKAVTMMELPLAKNDYYTGLNQQTDERTKRLVNSLLMALAQGGCDEPFREKNFF